MRYSFLLILLACACLLAGAAVAAAEGTPSDEPSVEPETPSEPALTQGQIQAVIDRYRRSTWHWQRVMKERGYPVDDFEQRAADISVEHPELVERYRTADGIARANERGTATTEDLRQSVRHYRALFEQLLGAGAADQPLARDTSRADTSGSDTSREGDEAESEARR